MSLLVEVREASGWADAHWTEEGPDGVERPLRFGSSESAQQAIEDFIAQTRLAEKLGDMMSHDPSDYRTKPTSK